MCTITLSYDQNNKLAQRKLEDLLKSGLFVRTETVTDFEMQELEHRMDEYERGEMQTIPQSEAYKRVMTRM